ncbi:MAG: hypothetical protein QE269_05035 [Fimbriimonas sp.]|jgi:NitT/TauT family transport system permease protein|nr:hypothetical protein [Fimbriimonas sp.]
MAQAKPGGLLDAFLPNRSISRTTFITIVVIQIAIFLLIWITSPFKVLPKPGEVASAFSNLWNTRGLGRELLTSIGLNFKAVMISSAICLLLAYFTVIPFFRPIVSALSKARFLSLIGFSLIFTLMLGGGPALKLSLLVFGMSVFFLTSMASVVSAIPKAEFDHARTLRMPEWKVVWEVVVLGTFDQAFEVMRQNAAIGWMMLTMVEGIARAEGGIGILLESEKRFFHIDGVFAIQITILVVGLCQDYLIGFVRNLLCPYANLSLERK